MSITATDARATMCLQMWASVSRSPRLQPVPRLALCSKVPGYYYLCRGNQCVLARAQG